MLLQKVIMILVENLPFCNLIYLARLEYSREEGTNLKNVLLFQILFA